MIDEEEFYKHGAGFKKARWPEVKYERAYEKVLIWSIRAGMLEAPERPERVR
jgi:hypothetical protein